MLGAPVTLPLVFGAVIIVFGIWLLSQEKDKGEGETKKILVKGLAASLGTAIIWSVSITMMNVVVNLPGASNWDANIAINTLRTAAMAAFLLVLSPMLDRERGFLKMQRRTLVELCVGGVAAMGIGWFLLNLSFLNTLESRAVPISSTTPLFSTLAGIVFLHEKVTMKNVLGSIIIVAGIFVIFIV